MPPVEPVSLPDPPPPRPAARDAAIEAAMRRFDGLPDQPKPATRSRRFWQRPQLQWAMAASLLLVVGLPATLIAIRDQGTPPNSVQAPVAHPPPSVVRTAPAMNFAPQADREAPPVQAKLEAPAAPPPARVQPVTNAPAASSAAESVAEPVQQETYAAAPPAAPPPPPPPAPAPTVAQKSAMADNTIVLTGSRLARPVAAQDHSYAAFLGRLQSAVRSDDRGAMLRLIRFPLRVNLGGGSRLYADAKSVRRDFERIFTPRVTQAILAQQADRLFVRDQGGMIGEGEVWFDHVCSNSSCSPPGPVRITAVNP